MRKVRRTRQSRGENLYAKALGESEKTVESEPSFITKPKIKGKMSMSYDEILPSNTSTESEKPRKKKPNILNYRSQNKRASVNYEDIVGDESIVEPSQEPNIKPRKTLSFDKSETIQLPQKARCEPFKIPPINISINPAKVISESDDDDDSPEKNVSTKKRFTSKHSQNDTNPYKNIISEDDDDEEEEEEIDIPNDSNENSNAMLDSQEQETSAKKSMTETSSFIENTEYIPGRISASGNLSSNRSTPSISEKDYTLNRDNYNNSKRLSQDISSNSSISEELKISSESPEVATTNQSISSSLGDQGKKNKLEISSFVENTKRLETVDTDDEENEENIEKNGENLKKKNKKNKKIEKPVSNKTVKSVEKNKQKDIPVFNETTKVWETIDTIDNKQRDSSEFGGTTKEWETIEDIDDDEPLFEEINNEKTPKKREQQSVSTKRTRTSKSIGKNFDDNGTKKFSESSSIVNKENKISEKLDSPKSIDKNLNKLSLNNSRNSEGADGPEVESTVTPRKSKTGKKKSLNKSNTSRTSRQKSQSKIQDESTVDDDESKNEEMNIGDDSENDKDNEALKTPRRSIRIRNSSFKKSEDRSVEIGDNSKSQKIVDNSSSDESDSSTDNSTTDQVIDPSAYELPSMERTGSFHVTDSESEDDKKSNSQLKNNKKDENRKKSIVSNSPSSSFENHKIKFTTIISDNSESDDGHEEEKKKKNVDQKKKKDSSHEKSREISKSFVETQENDSQEIDKSNSSDVEEETHPNVEDNNSKIIEKKNKSLQPERAAKSLDNKKSKENQYDTIISLEDDENSRIKTVEKSKDTEKPVKKPYKPGPRFTKSFLSQQPLSPIVIISTQENVKTPELPKQKTPSLNKKRKRHFDETEDQDDKDAGPSASPVQAQKKSLKSLTTSERKSLRSSKAKEKNQTNILNFFKPLNNTKRPETEFDKKLIEAKKKLDIKTKKDEVIAKMLSGKGKKVEINVQNNPLKTMLMAKRKLEKKNNKKVIDKAYLIDGRPYKVPKLPRPKYWVTDKLYKYLWKIMEPKYGSSTRVKSEKFIKNLAESVTLIERRKKYDNYVEELDALIYKMAKLGLIKTRFDFNHFCYDFLPYEFRVKVVPILMPGGKPNIPWDPKTINDPIIKR